MNYNSTLTCIREREREYSLKLALVGGGDNLIWRGEDMQRLMNSIKLYSYKLHELAVVYMSVLYYSYVGYLCLESVYGVS